MKKLFLILLLSVFTFSCTENQRAKKWGGTMTVELPKGKKLVEATWKNDNLWYLTRDMKEGETAETFEFIEDSSFGVMKGKIIFVESK